LRQGLDFKPAFGRGFVLDFGFGLDFDLLLILIFDVDHDLDVDLDFDVDFDVDLEKRPKANGEWLRAKNQELEARS